MEKKVHWFKPHARVLPGGRKIVKRTICGIENRTDAYRFTIDLEEVTCDRCIAPDIRKLIEETKDETNEHAN